MAEPPKEFPQTGADGHGQVSPQMGENWLPNDNAVIPAGFAPDFGTPAYEGESIIDFHPPTRIPDHPFKVNRYYSKREGKHIIRIREGRFYLTTNSIATGGPLDTTSGGGTHTYFTIEGDDGFPPFGNQTTPSVAQSHALPKEFSDSDIAGYALMDYPDNGEDAYVFVRYILKHTPNGKIDYAGITNDLNVVTVKSSSLANATVGAVNKPISAAVMQDDGTPVKQLMREDPSTVVPATLNSLSITGNREQYGAYYICLAKIEKIGTSTGAIVTQYVHENITLSVTNAQTTSSSAGWGE